MLASGHERALGSVAVSSQDSCVQQEVWNEMEFEMFLLSFIIFTLYFGIIFI